MNNTALTKQNKKIDNTDQVEYIPVMLYLYLQESQKHT